jgi:gliding motility-associated-like protein
MRYTGTGLCTLLLVLFVVPLWSQTNTYVLNGSATRDNCNCYTLTSANNFLRGSVWNASRIDLNQPFDFSFNVYLGCKDADGADGIVFILQTAATSIGGAGAGMGFEGVNPSIGISLDTWQNININDPAIDHISIQLNGSITHGTDLAGPIAASASSDNIEDCQWHTFRITWDPATQFISTWFDGVFRLQAQADLVNTVFNNHPDVFWGFSAGTGAANNLQQFCTALNPGFTTNFTSNTTCINNNVVAFNNTSVSFAPIAGFYWDFGDGTFSTAANPPPHIYAAPGLYKVRFAITGLDGCNSDTLEKTVVIGDSPVAEFDVYDTCTGKTPRVIDRSNVSVGTLSRWNWNLNGNPVSTAQHPQLNDLPAGSYTLQLQVTSAYGCISTAVQKQFTIKPTPVIKAANDGACVKVPVAFNGLQLDNATTISSWSWDFGDSRSGTSQTGTHTYTQTGSYSVRLVATANNGCKSEPSDITLLITKAVAFAGNDTVIIKNEAFRLHGTGGSVYNWSPGTGMNDPAIADPVVKLDDDISYLLTVITAEGCIDTDEIRLTVFKGSDIFIPTGFTPNNDGLNDGLLPFYKGIKTLNNFNIYNRWGQLIFSTSDQGRAWDGTLNGVKQGSGVYVWRIKGVDYIGKVYELEGTTTLIR